MRRTSIIIILGVIFVLAGVWIAFAWPRTNSWSGTTGPVDDTDKEGTVCQLEKNTNVALRIRVDAPVRQVIISKLQSSVLSRVTDRAPHVRFLRPRVCRIRCSTS